jgi:predicted  nucleic acid-binding Zn-ribbon protein
MAIAAPLFQLQQIDADLESRSAELAEVQQLQARNPELEASVERLEERRAQEIEARLEQRSLESELAELETRIKRDQTRMYSGQIVDSRELASLEKELQHLRAARDELEESLLLAMERLEGLEQSVAECSEHLNEVRDRWEEERPGLGDRALQLMDELTVLGNQRESLAASIDQRSMDLYLRLRASSGHPVSDASHGICQWCHVTVPQKDVQHARSGALVTCSNCGRILYVPG